MTHSIETPRPKEEQAVTHLPKTFDGRCRVCNDPHLTLVGEMESLDIFTHPHPSEGPMLRNRYKCPKGHETFELGYRSHLQKRGPA